MQIQQTFKPKFSNSIIGLYSLVSISLIAFFVGMIVFTSQEEAEGVYVIAIVLVAVTGLFGYIFYRAKHMRYDITQDSLIIHGVFKTHTIPLATIQTAQTSPPLFGFRLYGASLLGGLYYVPGTGKVWINMGNFSDGIFIKTTTQEHYFITPENPSLFIEAVTSRHKKIIA